MLEQVMLSTAMVVAIWFGGKLVVLSRRDR
jgi:hypothetical protein